MLWSFTSGKETLTCLTYLKSVYTSEGIISIGHQNFFVTLCCLKTKPSGHKKTFKGICPWRIISESTKLRSKAVTLICASSQWLEMC